MTSLSPLKQAFLALQDAQARVAMLEADHNEPVAVIGIGCRIPGVRTQSCEGFWTLLANHQDALGKGLPQRWRDLKAEADGVPERAHYAGLIDAPDCFDAEFFGISPREARWPWTRSSNSSQK